MPCTVHEVSFVVEGMRKYWSVKFVIVRVAIKRYSLVHLQITTFTRYNLPVSAGKNLRIPSIKRWVGVYTLYFMVWHATLLHTLHIISSQSSQKSILRKREFVTDRAKYRSRVPHVRVHIQAKKKSNITLSSPVSRLQLSCKDSCVHFISALVLETFMYMHKAWY